MWKRSLLVVANVTATSPELHANLKERAEREPLRVTLLVPTPPVGGDTDAAQERLTKALSMLAEAGIEADGSLGDDDVVAAVGEVWDPARFDEVLISTLPAGVSRWLEGGTPARIAKLTNAKVTQVMSQMPRIESHVQPPPPSKHLGVLSAFGALPHR